MSTSLLYHALGIIGDCYQSSHYLAGVVIVAIKEDREIQRYTLQKRYRRVNLKQVKRIAIRAI